MVKATFNSVSILMETAVGKGDKQSLDGTIKAQHNANHSVAFRS